MNDQTSFDLPLTQIVIPNDRTRALDPVWAEGLAGLMKAQGQINPISVRKINDGAYVLVSGLHRHAGAMINGATTIRCTLSTASTDAEARIEEVMENLGRHELNALDRCHHLYELKKAYEEAYPQTKHGGDRKSEKIKWQTLPLDTEGDEQQVFGFAKATADQLGLSQRSIRLAVKIWSGLTTESQFRLQGTSFARKQSELALLSAQIPRIQDRVLNILLADEPEYHSIADAVTLVTKGHVPEDTAKRFKALNVNLRKLPDPDFDRLLLENEERVISSLKRQGVL